MTFQKKRKDKYGIWVEFGEIWEEQREQKRGIEEQRRSKWGKRVFCYSITTSRFLFLAQELESLSGG
jgi:hypothetical protein